MKIYTWADSIDFCFYYFGIVFHFPMWDWEFTIPKYKNWFRLIICTPVIDFYVTGWVLWGKKQ